MPDALSMAWAEAVADLFVAPEEGMRVGELVSVGTDGVIWVDGIDPHRPIRCAALSGFNMSALPGSTVVVAFVSGGQAFAIGSR